MSGPTQTHHHTTVARHRAIRIDEESAIGIHQVLEKPIKSPTPSQLVYDAHDAVTRSWARFCRKGKKNVPVWQSLQAIFFHSWLNAFIIFVPLAWVAHYQGDPSKHEEGAWPYILTLSLCFLALVPLANLFEYTGEQLAHYMGKDLGDLIVVTLNNLTEATLAFILVSKCEIRLLQATIAGVILLHLCLIPGMSFFTGGARIQEQELHPHLAALNHVLLTTGVVCLFLPAIILTNTGIVDTGPGEQPKNYVDLASSVPLHRMSRGLAFLLLVVYAVSRVYLHNPPGEETSLHQHPDAPEELRHEEHHLATTEPEANQWVLLVVLAITIGIMAPTGEWLVDALEPVRSQRGLTTEWFGLILLPFIKFSADGAIASVIWVRRQLGQHVPKDTMAKAQAIDMSVQFILFWMPLFVLAGWWSKHPVPLVFDFFEIATLIGACLLVNYVTADGKTNYAEGFALMAFYLMCALCAWFYQGQPIVAELALCGPEYISAVTGIEAGGE